MRTISFGTVIDVLQQCKTDVVEPTDLTMAIINIAIPQESYTILGESDHFYKFNSLYKCKANLPNLFNDGNPLPCLKPDKSIIKQFEEKVVSLIAENKYRLAVLTLCDMIEKDCTLDPKNNGENIARFETYIKKPIHEFLNDKEYVFSEFLAEVCLYSINEVINRSCEKWVKQLTEKYKVSCEKLGGRAEYRDVFKDYIAGFESNTREIQVWGTFSEKEKSQNTASQAICNSSAITPPEEDTLCGETYEHYRKRTNTLVVRDIGPENKICLCCDNWIGDMENALKSPAGSSGECALKNEEKLSTTPMCKWAIPSLKRAIKHRGNIFDSQ